MVNVLKEKGIVLCSGLMVVALLLWIVSSFQARTAAFANMSELGLFSILPASFFVAFGVLVLSFFLTLKFVNKNRSILLIFQTLLLILFLNLTPVIIESTPRFSASYSNYVAVDYIAQYSHIDPSATWIHNWPGFSIFIDVLAQITLIPANFLMLTYSTFVNILLFLGLFILFRLSGKDSNLVWIAIWFVFFGNWVGQDYFSMQGLGFFFIAILLFLLFKNMSKGVKNRQWLVLFFLLFIYVVASHLLSSLVVLSIMLILLLSKQMYRRPLFFSLILLVVGWTIFSASTYLSNNLSRILSQVLNISQIFQGNLLNRLASGSYSHILIAEVRVIYSLAIMAFAILGIIVSWKNKEMTSYGKRMLFVLVGIGLLVFAFAYGGELFMRAYMFSLIPLAYFAAKVLLKYKKLFFISVLFFVIAAPSLLMIAHYGNEITYVPNSETTGVAFLYRTTTTGHIYGGSPFQGGDFRDMAYHSSYTYYSFRELFVHNISSNLWTIPRDTYENRYVCLSYATYSYFSFFYGYPEFTDNIQSNISQCVSYNLLYANPSFHMYSSGPIIGK